MCVVYKLVKSKCPNCSALVLIKGAYCFDCKTMYEKGLFNGKKQELNYIWREFLDTNTTDAQCLQDITLYIKNKLMGLKNENIKEND